MYYLLTPRRFSEGQGFFNHNFFLLDQPLCSLWYKICACHRIHRKRPRTLEIISRKTYNHDYVQDRDKRHSNSYPYNSDSVPIFDSIGIIELDASQNRALAGVGKATREKILGVFKGGQYNESLVQQNKE